MKYIAAAMLSLVATSVLLMPVNAQLGPYAYGERGTQWQLQNRITEGVRTGEISREEAARLQIKLNRIEALEGRYRVTPREHERINTQLTKLSIEIDHDINECRHHHNHEHRHF